ncbi:50S ribosomal protein L29 [bacterium]|nr:50S ribosomal protein L29 [bacterium]
MKIQDIRNMTKDELLHQRSLFIEEWFNLRMQAALKPLDNPKRIHIIRKDLARINTILHENELGIRKIIGE